MHFAKHFWEFIIQFPYDEDEKGIKFHLVVTW